MLLSGKCFHIRCQTLLPVTLACNAVWNRERNCLTDVGADIMDSTGQSVSSFGSLEEEDTWFELSSDQRKYFDSMRYMNSYLREEFHAIQDLLWKSGETNMYGRLPKRKYNPITPPDACRLNGTITLNKVAGNFHITAGQALALPQGHIHMSAFMSDRDYNFTHRIHRFSFGDPSPGIIHPLEGDEKIAPDIATSKCCDDNGVTQRFPNLFGPRLPLSTDMALRRT
ncbi:Endoplasmic reticulum-Golgi intermediate compartment protein 2 [Homalodisca vitripennis]|nr:Endoplasmic reticulum-Golgi intermediate compartment protein 2 [Homalodisca vitripennis]